MKKRFYGKGAPEVDTSHLAGKLIVVEGADGSGRSTQIQMLQTWLESRGYAVASIGLKRSNLVSEELEEARQGNSLGRLTMSLFYATDFADQLENTVFPALRSGFIVLADRYIYTLMARDLVRGADWDWLMSLYGIALIPDAVFYLLVSPQTLVERNFQKNTTINYWESGMDMGISADLFKSFMTYQRKMQTQFKRLHKHFNFHVINGNRPVPAIANELQAEVADILNMKDVPDSVLAVH
ncbi:MAG: thymidylate kinase [Verrucomicrobiae bacterium]|nr:thymidylate kinase [Verrucomicrobiae bacterium]